MAGRSIEAGTIKQARAHLVARPELGGRVLARRLSQQMDAWFESLAGEMPPGWALAATGGYASGLLCPGSDVDVVLLHPSKVRPAEVTQVAESLWYPMWDAGVKLSPAVHSDRSLLRLASDDLVTATSILRLRHLAGDVAPVEAAQVSGGEQWRKKAIPWLTRLHAANEERRARFGEVASLLEPDLKDGRGGLRDHDAIRWALAVGRDDVSAALESPLEDLAGAAEELLAVRCELQRVMGKSTNVLLLQDQDAVAAAMGFLDADVLMSKVAAAARLIDWASQRFWWRIERIVRLGSKAITGVRRSMPEPIPGVGIVDDEVEIAPGTSVDSQSLALRVAAAAAHAGFPISRHALLTLSSGVTDDAEPWTDRTRQAFVSLLGAGQDVVAAVEALEQYDLFSRYLPEWRHVRSLPQRNAFHTFNVDRHLLQTVANANRFIRDVARPDLLLIGALLHDIGKGYPGDHTDVGLELVERIGPRMGFGPADVGIILGMVRNHLLLSETAMRRDLSDPRTARNVADAVGTVGELELLRALTEADSLATGPSAWSSWKAALINSLVESVRAELAGVSAPVDTSSADRFASYAERVRGDRSLFTMNEPLGDLFVLRVATPDQHGLFANIAGVLTIHGLDVLSAEAWTDGDSIAVDEFLVSVRGGAQPNWSKVEHDLRGALDGTVDIVGKLEQRIKTYERVHRRALAATAPRLEVLISNTASDSTTMIDVRAPDAIAVLYRLSARLAAKGFDIRSAKVATLGHEVVDVFYVQTNGGLPAGQIPDAEHGALRDDLKLALART